MADLNLMKTLTRSSDTKIILLVMDGLGGLPREVGGPTELEAAESTEANEGGTVGEEESVEEANVEKQDGVVIEDWSDSEEFTPDEDEGGSAKK